jgi:RNA polymerase sigma-70 factor (ECF subfamily)
VGTYAVENPPQPSFAISIDEDLVLVHATRAGETAAFEKLVRKYDRKLMRIAQSVTRNREEAEDAVQEAFLKAYQRLGQFQENAKFSTWLIRIALNESLIRLRKQRSNRELPMEFDSQTDGDTLPLDVADWAPNPHERYSAAEFREILTKCLEGLQPALRVVFVLRDIEEVSNLETAELLGLTPVAVKARLFRARLHLREKLSLHFKKPAAEALAVEGALERRS